MADLILKMVITLDGLVGGPDGEVSWMSIFADDEEERHEVATLWRAQAHLMGSRTFNDMKIYWPTTEGPIAAAMNAIPKIVFSRRGVAAAGTTTSLEESLASRASAGRETKPSPDAATWDDPEVLSGGLAEEFRKLKSREGKPFLIHGGAGFARSAIATDLIDEFRLTLHPLALGKGLGIFDGLSGRAAFEVNTVVHYKSGLVGLTMTPKAS